MLLINSWMCIVGYDTRKACTCYDIDSVADLQKWCIVKYCNHFYEIGKYTKQASFGRACIIHASLHPTLFC